MAPHLDEGTAPWPTLAAPEARAAPAQPGAQPWKVWGLRGASKPALNCPQNDDVRIFNQVYAGQLSTGVKPEDRAAPPGFDWPRPEWPVALLPVLGGNEVQC